MAILKQVLIAVAATAVSVLAGPLSTDSTATAIVDAPQPTVTEVSKPLEGKELEDFLTNGPHIPEGSIDITNTTLATELMKFREAHINETSLAKRGGACKQGKCPDFNAAFDLFEQHWVVPVWGSAANYWTLKALLLIFLVSCHFISAKAAEPRLVFAHYLLFQPDTVETLKKEIVLAQSKGIDGFVLNSNVWREQRADDMYEAAKQVGSSFKIFFSADIHKDANGNLTPDQLVTMLSAKYASHPNQMTYQGKPLFSAWLGSNDSWWADYSYTSALDGWKDVFQKAGGKANFFFIPFFPTDGSYWGVRGTAEKFTDVIDGLFAWDTSAWPYFDNDFQNPSDSKDQNYLKALNDVGKEYMASPSPWFFKDCEVKGNYQGPGLWMTRWEQLIKLNPPLLEIVTWNDWVESSYVAPSLSSSTDAANVADFTHRAFLELGQYYISWYKSGSAPTITQDSLYLFYYTHSKNVVVSSSGCQLSDFAELSDKVYVTAMLTAPASVQLQSGSSSQTFSAEAGISTWSMDFQEGQQSAVLTRDGREVSKLVGSKDISNSNVQKYNFNVYSTCTTCN